MHPSIDPQFIALGDVSESPDSRLSPSDTSSAKTQVLERIAQAWNNAGIEYAVTHGLENYPANTGRDLDILVHRRDLNAVLEIATSILEEYRWTTFFPPPVWGHRILAVQNAAWASLLELHFIHRLSWRNVVLTRSFCATSRKGPFKIDPWASFAKRILLPLLANKTERLMKRSHELNISPEEHARIQKFLPDLCGTTTARRLLNLPELDTTELQNVAAELQRYCFLRGMSRTPLSALLTAIQAARRKITQYFSPCAPVVALVGPDGVGKSTVIEHLSANLADHTQTIVNHWRPSLLPRLGWFVGKPSVELQANGLILPRRQAGRFPLFRVGYYFIDYVLGYFIRDRLNSSRQRLVIYDRCALDMAVDPLRFGLPTPRGTRMLWRFIPKPDLVILLYDEPARIHARKPELPTEEIGRQNAKWLELVAEGVVDAVIQVDAGPKDIAERIESLILGKFIEKNARSSLARQADVAWLRGILQGQDL